MAKTAAPPPDPSPTTEVRARDVFYSSADGLQLYARDYGDRLSPWLPVVCLPGLTRTGRDFHALATHLSTEYPRARRVVAFDYRGRGRSAWDRKESGYNPMTETADIFSGLAALNIPRAILIGTSRGGIIATIMALQRPAMVAGLILNDIGPAVEARGLARLKTYVGRTPMPDDWADAARIQRRLHGGAFTKWNDAEWEHFARLTYAEEKGRPVSDYDPALANTLAGIEFDQPMPALWNEFRALKDIPILAIRGENSDLLSAATLKAMVDAHPSVETVTIADEGHAPLLRGTSLVARISAFAAKVEGTAPRPGVIVARELPANETASKD